MMRVILVGNSSSGSSDEEVLQEVAGRLSSLGPVDRVEPESADSFGDDIRRALGDEEALIVSAGGDGTMNCTVNGFAGDFEGRTFALIPMGTGNDLARTLGLDSDPVAAAQQVVDGTDTFLDVGRASAASVDQLFVNACMGGFPVKVNQAIEDDVKARFGPLSFWVGGTKAAADLTRWTVHVDGEEFSDVVATGVGNGKTAGGGITVWPDADPTDGELDLCVLPAEGVADALKLAATVKRGAHQNIANVTMRRARRFEIKAEPDIEFNCDGELIDLVSPVTFELVDRLRMRVPAG
ncbi:MAG: diacylglycerol/lipid kinase family protein [Actinomycetota bacterium]